MTQTMTPFHAVLLAFTIMACARAADPTAHVTPAKAQDSNAMVDSVAVEAAVYAFSNAFKSLEYEAIVAAIPPTLLKAIAEPNGFSVAEMRTKLIEVLPTVMEGVTFVDLQMDVANATYGRSPKGLAYAMIPTWVITDSDEGRVRGTSITLAVEEDGAWYLIRIASEVEINQVRAAFPDLDHLKFPLGTLEFIEQE
jgi:hypothetical protein